MKELRDYQLNIVSKVLNSDKDLIICLPTGAGKTIVAFSIIKELNGKNIPVVFVVPRLELIKQASEEFGDVDIVWSNKTQLTGKNCIIASKDSLRTQFDELPQNCVLIFDEAHIGLEQTHKLIKQINPARVIGLTATPERMDGKALLKGDDAIHKFGCFDELLQEETVDSLIKKGFLCPLKYYTKPIDGITEIKPDDANGQELSDEQMKMIFDQNQIWGDLVASYEKYGIKNGKRRPALGFTNTVAMAEKVAGIFNESGYNFKVISGEMSVNEREVLITELREEKIDGLINAALLTYGFDCPPVSYAFSCRHIKSRPLWFQIVGRILRLSDGKEDAVFIDHGDSVSEFEDPACSLPILDPCIKWRVDGESQEERSARKKAQKKEKESLKILQELDPLPCDMVEVKAENTWERMIKVINRLRLENGNLSNLIKTLRQQTDELNIENERLSEELKTNENKRFIDSDATFDFCKKNYWFVRNLFHEKFWNNPQMMKLTNDERKRFEHENTIKELLRQSKDLSFLLDMRTFNNSMKYWEKNYVYIKRY